jgi:hypothetical protein
MNPALEAFVLFLGNQHPTVVFVIMFALLGSPVAVTVIVLWTWIYDGRAHSRLLSVYRKDMTDVLTAYGKHIDLVTSYYERNVELVKSWQSVAEGFQSTVVLNTQALSKMCTLVETRQDCPMVRPKAPKF